MKLIKFKLQGPETTFFLLFFSFFIFSPTKSIVVVLKAFVIKNKAILVIAL